MAEKQNTKTAFGAANLQITEEDGQVVIRFDPERHIGQFKSGNPMVASTGSYRTLDRSGVKLMLHVIGRTA